MRRRPPARGRGSRRAARPSWSAVRISWGCWGHLRRHGAATPGEVAAAERQRPQSLTRVFAELESDGLIARTADGADRRQSVLTFTAEGLRALERDLAEHDAWPAAALGTLNETGREVLRLAAALMDRLADTEPRGTSSGTADLQKPPPKSPPPPPKSPPPPSPKPPPKSPESKSEPETSPPL
ncbi:MarR family transcriptional regulator [Streptomyces sp. RLB3-17]|nr:MarR family transcriptional regulator [Streptomyces sp. RLB1-9]QDO22740.1 MarR family transcriptional regulator [Streptomyces sp. S1A1-8]QDO32867.1 MarR family transcriptional regulator [Streptomyces sp. S1A1-3]QDO42799.1 MarR family transcriptional regulator [Streptomyces sp. RLB3-17]